MCGRYRLARKKEILAEVFDARDDVDWSPRYNIAPSQSVPVVRQAATRPVRSISLIRWGLIPFWAKDAKAGYKMINARAGDDCREACFPRTLAVSPLSDSRRRILRVVEIQQGKASFLFYPSGRFSFCACWNLGPKGEPGARSARNVFDHYDFGKCTSVRNS